MEHPQLRSALCAKVGHQRVYAIDFGLCREQYQCPQGLGGTFTVDIVFAE
jgi:hypothetical protein